MHIAVLIVKLLSLGIILGTNTAMQKMVSGVILKLDQVVKSGMEW